MTALQRNAISTPVAGLMVWCSNCGSNGEIQIYNGIAWVNFIGGTRQMSSAISTKLGIDIDGEANTDNSGMSVAISSDGSIVAIGAPYNDGGGSNAGQVRVYRNIAGTWTQIGADINGEAWEDYSGTSVAISSDGTKVAIGATGNSGNTGHVRVYQYSNNAWTKIGADIDGEAAEDNSGMSVAISSDGTKVAIGAPGNNLNTGQVRVYQYSNNAWTKIGADIDGEAANDNSGWSVAISSDGTTVAIGALSNDGVGSNAGHVRVYKYITGAWTQIGVDIDGEAASDFSGISVAMSSDGTTVAIGATGNSGNTGHVRVYQYSNNAWTKIGADIDGEAALNNSGSSVAISSDGNTIAIGAPSNSNNNGTAAGQVRVYQNIAGTWTKLGLDIDGEAAYDNSGYSVAISSDGTTVAIGAPYNDGGGSNAGQVRVYLHVGAL